MTGREQILATIRGEPTHKLLYTPRIDLWYRSHLRNHTLPAKWTHTNMWDILRDIGGQLYYPNIQAYREKLHGVEILETVDGKSSKVDQPITAAFSGRDIWGMGDRWGEVTLTEYRTPKGTVSTKHVWTQDMCLDGVQLPQLKERMIKGVEDYPVVEYILEHTEYEPDYEVVEEVISEIKDEGIVIGGASWSPIHTLMNDYIGYSDFFYQMNDHPSEFERLLQVFNERMWDAKEIAARSPAEIVMVDCNWSDSITSPPIFSKYISPYLERVVDLMHRHGKLTTCHVDGDMKRLFKLFAATGVDVAEALAPEPLCNFTLEEARGSLKNMTLWGGIPTPLFTTAYTDEDFDTYVRNIFRTIAPGGLFILAMGDNIPPDGVFQRAYRVTQLVEELGEMPI